MKRNWILALLVSIMLTMNGFDSAFAQTIQPPMPPKCAPGECPEGLIPVPLPTLCPTEGCLPRIPVPPCEGTDCLPPEIPPRCLPGWCQPQRREQVEATRLEVNTNIRQQVAVTRVKMELYNPGSVQAEGSFLFPLPKDAVVSQFDLWIDGEPVKGKLMEAAEARGIYEEIVRSQMDPALLEFVGRGVFQASVFPIPAGGSRLFEMEYTETLVSERGLVRYAYPFNMEKYLNSPLQQAVIRVRVESQEAVQAIYSPTHAVDIQRDSNNRFQVTYEASQVVPNSDFTLYYSLGEAQALHLMTYRDPYDSNSADGYFLLLMAPPVNKEQAKVAKDVLLVLDRSGSMEGEKFRQAQDALRYVLGRLNEDDRFWLMTFNSSADRFSKELSPASRANQALQWVDQLWAAGSTNIDLALQEAAAVADPERPTYVIFLTDGLPTEGETSSAQILANFQRHAGENLRVFSFGVGYDVDTYLLDSLSQDHHGVSTYVKPGEALDERLSGFYEKISTPVMTNMELDLQPAGAYDLYPNPLPDLFAGSQIVVVGRYRTPGAITARLSGRVGDRMQSMTFPGLEFTADDAMRQNPNSFIPRLWATRKIGYLLNKVRLDGPDQETVDQIVRLSIRYGIVTPYTSYLVTEPEFLSASDQERLSAQQMETFKAQATQPAFGADAVNRAADQGAMSQAEQAPAAPAPMLGETSGDGSSQVAQPTVRLVGDATFVLQGQKWLDTRFDAEKMKPIQIKFLSDQYFKLLEANPEVASAFSLGSQVIVVIRGQAFEIGQFENGDVLPIQPPASKVGPVLDETPIGSAPTSDLVTSTPAATVESSQTTNPVCLGFLLPALLAVVWRFFL